jgi:hypothetical protein
MAVFDRQPIPESGGVFSEKELFRSLVCKKLHIVTLVNP